MNTDLSRKKQKNLYSFRVAPCLAVSKYFCYILECSDGTFYTGWSTDPERRARQHNQGTGARYTRSRRPVRVVYVEEQPDRAIAMKRERAIKSLSRKQKKKLINGGMVKP